MATNNILDQLTFSDNRPVKTLLLEQEHFDLVVFVIKGGGA